MPTGVLWIDIHNAKTKVPDTSPYSNTSQAPKTQLHQRRPCPSSQEVCAATPVPPTQEEFDGVVDSIPPGHLIEILKGAYKGGSSPFRRFLANTLLVPKYKVQGWVHGDNHLKGKEVFVIKDSEDDSNDEEREEGFCARYHPGVLEIPGSPPEVSVGRSVSKDDNLEAVCDSSQEGGSDVDYDSNGGGHSLVPRRGRQEDDTPQGSDEDNDSQDGGLEQNGSQGECSQEESDTLVDAVGDTVLGHWTCCLLAAKKRSESGSYCIIGRHRDEAIVPQSLKRLRTS
ncbi:MAG: hypothetical protein MMC33_009542 [Icmadophila ericetorum]|nr:hypothetical protein [Icmadophila ericetorum]